MCLRYEAIYNAVMGDRDAIEEVLKYYGAYITSLCTFRTIGEDGLIYEYIDYAIRTPGDKPHFFELNFYLNNRVHNFYKEKPQSGFLVITHSDYMMCVDGFKKQGYKFKFIKNWAEFDMDLYQFNK